MNHDKKKNNTSIDFITIKEIGTAEIQSLPIAQIELYLNEFLYAKDH
jgi:3-dehydroquinate synthetase